jgi:hypothetical protein
VGLGNALGGTYTTAVSAVQVEARQYTNRRQLWLQHSTLLDPTVLPELQADTGCAAAAGRYAHALLTSPVLLLSRSSCWLSHLMAAGLCWAGLQKAHQVRPQQHKQLCLFDIQSVVCRLRACGNHTLTFTWVSRQCVRASVVCVLRQWHVHPPV